MNLRAEPEKMKQEQYGPNGHHRSKSQCDYPQDQCKKPSPDVVIMWVVPGAKFLEDPERLGAGGYEAAPGHTERWGQSEDETGSPTGGKLLVLNGGR